MLLVGDHLRSLAWITFTGVLVLLQNLPEIADLIDVRDLASTSSRRRFRVSTVLDMISTHWNGRVPYGGGLIYLPDVFLIGLRVSRGDSELTGQLSRVG